MSWSAYLTASKIAGGAGLRLVQGGLPAGSPFEMPPVGEDIPVEYPNNARSSAKVTQTGAGLLTLEIGGNSWRLRPATAADYIGINSPGLPSTDWVVTS